MTALWQLLYLPCKAPPFRAQTPPAWRPLLHQLPRPQSRAEQDEDTQCSSAEHGPPLSPSPVPHHGSLRGQTRWPLGPVVQRQLDHLGQVQRVPLSPLCDLLATAETVGHDEGRGGRAAYAGQEDALSFGHGDGVLV